MNVEPGFCRICGMPNCERPHSGRKGWLLVGAIVLTWDVLADETLSSAFLRRRNHPLTVAAYMGLTAHLFGFIPRKYDPFAYIPSIRR